MEISEVIELQLKITQLETEIEAAYNINNLLADDINYCQVVTKQGLTYYLSILKPHFPLITLLEMKKDLDLLKHTFSKIEIEVI
jgi:hypothetical protein